MYSRKLKFLKVLCLKFKQKTLRSPYSFYQTHIGVKKISFQEFPWNSLNGKLKIKRFWHNSDFDDFTAHEYSVRMKFFLQCVWVCLRVEHLGQDTSQAFQKPVYSQKSCDALFLNLIANLAYFKDKEFLIFLGTFSLLSVWAHAVQSSEREDIQLQKPGANPHSQGHKQCSRLGRRDIEIHFQWNWAILCSLEAHHCSGAFLCPCYPTDSYGS